LIAVRYDEERGTSVVESSTGGEADDGAAPVLAIVDTSAA